MYTQQLTMRANYLPPIVGDTHFQGVGPAHYALVHYAVVLDRKGGVNSINYSGEPLKLRVDAEESQIHISTHNGSVYTVAFSHGRVFPLKDGKELNCDNEFEKSEAKKILNHAFEIAGPPLQEAMKKMADEKKLKYSAAEIYQFSAATQFKIAGKLNSLSIPGLNCDAAMKRRHVNAHAALLEGNSLWYVHPPPAPRPSAGSLLMEKLGDARQKAVHVAAVNRQAIMRAG